MKKNFRVVYFLIVGMMLAALASGCTGSTPSGSTGENDAILFTDSVGREVRIPKTIERIAPAGTLAQILLYSICPEKLGGWSAAPKDVEKKYIGKKYHALPVFGQFYGKNVSLNLEALIAAKPDVIIDIGEVKPTVKEDMDNIQQQTGIPVIFVEATLKTLPETYETLGQVTGMTDEAAALSNYCADTIRDAQRKNVLIADGKKKSVFYAEGEKGLQTDPSGSIHADVIDIVGGYNVAQIENMTGVGMTEVSMEQLILWDPDVILVSPGTIYDTMGSDPLWQELKAVQNGDYFEIPFGPYNWMGRPPSINRLIGIKWLGNLLYPDVFEYDMVKEAREFYGLFYHYDLSEEEAKDLIENSTLK